MDKSSWEKLWQSCKGSVYQSWDWAKIKEDSGSTPIFITLPDLNAGILAFEKELSTPLGKKKILVSEGAPLFLNEEAGLKILNEFKSLSKKYFYGTISPTVINPQPDLFKKAGYKKVSNYTLLVDLTKTEKELFQNLEKKSARWGVNFAEKSGLVFSELSQEEINDFYLLYNQTTIQGGFNKEPIEFIRLSTIINQMKGFVVKKGGLLLAGGVVLICNDYVVLNLTTASEEGHKYQSMPFLYWNIIKFAKSLGRNYLDLGGYDKEAKEGEKTFSINKFKERFGGQVVEQPVYSTNWKYPFFRSLIKNFKLAKKLYSKK